MKKKKALSLLLALVLCLSLLPITALADVPVLHDGSRFPGADFALEDDGLGWWGFEIAPTPENPTTIEIWKTDDSRRRQQWGIWDEDNNTYYVELSNAGSYDVSMQSNTQTITAHFYGGTLPFYFPQDYIETFVRQYTYNPNGDFNNLNVFASDITHTISGNSIKIAMKGDNIPKQLYYWYSSEELGETIPRVVTNNGADQFFIPLEYNDPLFFETTSSGLGDVLSPYWPENPFIDVTDQWAVRAVRWAVENGVTTGTSETTFSPDGTVTRAQIVTFLWRFMNHPEPTSANNPFTDVPEDSWFYKAVLWAVEQNITTGTSATTFSPENICTHAEVLTFLYRLAGKPDNSVEITDTEWEEDDDGGMTEIGEVTYANSLDYAIRNRKLDLSSVNLNAWYADPLLWAIRNLVAHDNTIQAIAENQFCSRLEMIYYLLNVRGMIPGYEESVPY